MRRVTLLWVMVLLAACEPAARPVAQVPASPTCPADGTRPGALGIIERRHCARDLRGARSVQRSGRSPREIRAPSPRRSGVAENSGDARRARAGPRCGLARRKADVLHLDDHRDAPDLAARRTTAVSGAAHGRRRRHIAHRHHTRRQARPGLARSQGGREPRALRARSEGRTARGHSAQAARADLLRVHDGRLAVRVLPRERRQAGLLRHLPLRPCDARARARVRRAGHLVGRRLPGDRQAPPGEGSRRQHGGVLRVRPLLEKARAALRPGREGELPGLLWRKSRARCWCSRPSSASFAASTAGRTGSFRRSRRKSRTTWRASRSTARKRASSIR